MGSRQTIREQDMNLPNFFSFSSKLASSTFPAHLADSKIDHHKLIKGDYTEIDFPVIFKQKHGDKLLDLLDTGCVGLFLISDKLKMVLEENHLTGWETFSVKISDKNDNLIPGYHGLSITGRCESTSFDQSNIIEKQLVSTGPICKYYRGISINQWDGSDLFSPEKKYQTFITQKTANLLKKNKITNLQLENTAEYEVDNRQITKNQNT
jgi:hypothetical protein